MTVVPSRGCLALGTSVGPGTGSQTTEVRANRVERGFATSASDRNALRQGCDHLRRGIGHRSGDGADVHARRRQGGDRRRVGARRTGGGRCHRHLGTIRTAPATKEESWAAVVAATTRLSAKLDVLVNNAGISGSAEQDFTAPKLGTGSWRSTRPACSSA
jgi:NAD(P)-dependent dehydrogenase (short-subunit alcohol dehydrogenase family)